MSDKKISQLPAATTPLAGTEVLPIVQSGVTDKVAVSDLTAGRAVSAASLSLTTSPLGIASGGTNQTAFTAPSGNVKGLVYFDGTRFANDTTVTDAGYDTTTNTLNARNFSAGGTAAITGSVTVNTDAVFLDATNKRIGIGSASPSREIYISKTAAPSIYMKNNTQTNGVDIEYNTSDFRFQVRDNIPTVFLNNNAEAMRIQPSGGVSIGNTTDKGNGSVYASGISYSGNRFSILGNGGTPTGSEIAVGTNGVGSRMQLNVPTSGEFDFAVNAVNVAGISGTAVYPMSDNASSSGLSFWRWSVVYAATGTINTSDANSKQQIRNLEETELAVAKRCKALIRAFKFNDSVAEKGDNARIHFGVIAQDVKAAFEAEGLNAENYGVFCSDTWYEVDGKVEDAEGNKYTKDSPNAVEIVRLGVRYDELFAFIIAAL